MEREAASDRPRCPDCVQCQMCSRSRCRACQKGRHMASFPRPGVGLTHGAYLEWKRERDAARQGEKNEGAADGS